MLLYVLAAARAEPIALNGGAQTVSSYQLAGVTTLTGLPAGTVQATATAGSLTCGLPVSGTTATLLASACPQAFRIGPDASILLTFLDKDGKSTGGATLGLQQGYSLGATWIIAPGGPVTLPDGVTGEKLSFQVEGRAWYRAGAVAGRLVADTDDGKAALAEWARGAADTTVRVRKVLETTEQEWQIQHARPNQPANAVSELDWPTASGAVRPISFLMSFKLINLPEKGKNDNKDVTHVSIAAAGASCVVEVVAKAAQIDTSVCRDVLEKAGQGLTIQLLSENPRGPRYSTVDDPLTVTTPPLTPTAVQIRPTDVPKLPSWLVASPTVAWRIDNGWMPGTLQSNSLTTADPFDAKALSDWLKGSDKALTVRARAGDSTLREGEWVFTQGPGPAHVELTDATLTLTPAEDNIFEIRAAKLAGGTLTFAGSSAPIAVYRNGTYLGSSHKSGTDQVVTAADLPAAFALSGKDTLTFSGTRASLMLAPTSQSYTATRREGSNDLRKHLLIPDNVKVITIRRGDGPWTIAWLRPEDIPPRKVHADVVEQDPSTLRANPAVATVPPLVETWKIEADPSLPLYVRWEEGTHEVERIVTWDGTPDWCQAGPSDPSAWERGRDLTYVVCFDVKSGAVRPILPTGVPILYPNQPIAVVVRAPETLGATVSVSGKAGIERGGATLPPEAVAGKAVDSVPDTYGAKTTTSTWHFAPRTRDEPIAVTIATKAAGEGVNGIDLLVRPVYSSAIRVGLGGSFVVGERSFAAVAQPGTSGTYLGEQQSPFVPEVVVGYMMSVQRTPREDAFPRLRPVNVAQRLAPYVGIGVIGPATTLGTESIPLDFFTTLHVGVDFEISPSASVTFTHVIHRSASLWEGWNVGDPYPASGTATAVTYRPGVAIILNVSPKFFRFAQTFAANPADAALEE